jgi:hypothetical protein
MRTGRLVAAISLSALVSIALAGPAGAFGGRGGSGGGGGRSSGFSKPGFSHGARGSGFKGFQAGFNSFNDGGFRGGYNRSFPGLDGFGPGFGGFPGFRSFNKGFKGFNGFGGAAPWWGWGTTTVWAAPPSDGYAYAAPMYYPVPYVPAAYYPPVYAAPAPAAPPPASSVSVVPPVPPAATVVSFPSGRYELRGDGGATPYQWVWIPNPPSAPPPPPTAPPPAPESRSPEPQADGPAPRRSQLYRWTDEQGVVHWTNQAEAVPPKHRSQAKRGPSS